MSEKCKRCGYDVSGDDRFCPRCGGPLAALDLSGEIKVVAVLFADIKGFTALAEKLPADRVAAVVNRYLNALDDVVTRYGGSIDKHLGDGLMALFGAPVAVGEEADRAVRAGLAMQAEIAGISEELKSVTGPLPLRVGIDIGPVYFGSVGTTGVGRALLGLGEPDKAAAAFEQGLASADEEVFDRAILEYHLAESYLKLGDREKVKACVSSAAEVFNEAGCGYWIEKAERLSREAGGH